MSTFSEGAVMAYRDCAALCKVIAADIPEDASWGPPLKKHFDFLHSAMIEKSNEVIRISALRKPKA